jgi:hypothetical protein
MGRDASVDHEVETSRLGLDLSPSSVWAACRLDRRSKHYSGGVRGGDGFMLDRAWGSTLPSIETRRRAGRDSIKQARSRN